MCPLKGEDLGKLQEGHKGRKSLPSSQRCPDPYPSFTHTYSRNGMSDMWVSIASEAVCALHQRCCKRWTRIASTLQSVLQHDAAGFARVQCARHCGQKLRAPRLQALFWSASQWLVLAHRRPTI